RTSSIFWMYSGFSSATHHIFSPPRLQAVAEQQDPHRLPPHLGHQFALDGLFSDQTDGPTGVTFRRLTTNHGDDPLLLGSVQQLLGTPPLPLVERTRQPATPISVADSPHRLRGQMHHLGHR